MKNVSIIICVIALAGCSTMKADFQRFASHDCNMLADEIKQYEQQLEAALTNRTEEIADQVFGGREIWEESEVDFNSTYWDEQNARRYLQELNRLAQQKSC